MKVLILSSLLLALVNCSSSTPAPITQCVQVTSEAACNNHNYNGYCAWQNNACQTITSCSDITNRQVCDNSPTPFNGCVWDKTKQCFKPSAGTCNAVKDQTSCNTLASCFWDNTASECQLASACSDLTVTKNPTNCNDTNLSATNSCYWTPGGQCAQITNCGDVPTKDDCHGSYTVGGSIQYCYWELAGNCGVVNQCSDAPTQDVCSSVEQALSCLYSSDGNACVNVTSCGAAIYADICPLVLPASGGPCTWDTLATPNPVCELTTPLLCTDIKDSTACSGKPGLALGCIWSNGVCNAVAQCSDGSGSATLCADLIKKGVSCQYCGTTCSPLDTTKCSSATCMTSCNAINTCNWDANATPSAVCELKTPGKCGDIKDANSCNANANLKCYWNGGTCTLITSCSQALSSADCDQQQYASSYCQWTPGSPGSCAAVSRCQTFNNQADCNVSTNQSGQACSWQHWSGRVPDPTLYPNGADSSTGACGEEPTVATQCSGIIDPNHCNNVGSTICYWPNFNGPCTLDQRICSAKTLCSQIPNNAQQCIIDTSGACCNAGGSCGWTNSQGNCQAGNPCVDRDTCPSSLCTLQ